MQRKLTITIDEKVYKGLYASVGVRKISRFIENLVKPHLLKPDLNLAYREMAMDQTRENEAINWSESLIGDVHHEKR